MLKTFRIGGIHPKENKLTSQCPVTAIPVPRQVSLMLNQHIGAPANCIVKKGDTVKVGTLIAEANGFLSSNIHSPVSGTVSKIDKIAKSIIQNERLKVSGISAALGTPGGAAMVATIPTDIAQYYGCLLRVAQKLMYLYGFSQIEYDLDGQCFDTETMNQIILCMGVMFGVANAKSGLLTLAKALGKGVEKKLINKALTKGTIYPIVKSVSKWFGVKMTKEVFAGFFKKAIPVVGGVIGGGLSYATFKPCCERLKNVLKDTYLSNPNYEENEEELEILDVAYESVE